MKLLHIDSSIQGEASASRELTREIVARWRAERPDTEVTYVDLGDAGAAASVAEIAGPCG